MACFRVRTLVTRPNRVTLFAETVRVRILVGPAVGKGNNMVNLSCRASYAVNMEAIIAKGILSKAPVALSYPITSPQTFSHLAFFSVARRFVLDNNPSFFASTQPGIQGFFAVTD